MTIHEPQPNIKMCQLCLCCQVWMILTRLHTSAGVDLQLPVNVALVHQRMENIEDAVDVPDLWVVSQELDLLLGLFGCFTAVLTERLELLKNTHIIVNTFMVVCKGSVRSRALYLVNELINDVPQPLVRQLQRCRAVSICIQTQTQVTCVLINAAEETTKNENLTYSGCSWKGCSNCSRTQISDPKLVHPDDHKTTVFIHFTFGVNKMFVFTKSSYLRWLWHRCACSTVLYRGWGKQRLQTKETKLNDKRQHLQSHTHYTDIVVKL